ncbi:Uncharacterised protein [Legionella busanensis]|uniref:Uncharacterized protein n=1 Tax=Legionella busanensis TaxID=190655 RepID=A0A378JSI5_9GAMM|nr:hypothetical protein [Legionella busanensis]STX51132.1 Uncharacterised protein [Legionella busanensis]
MKIDLNTINTIVSVISTEHTAIPSVSLFVNYCEELMVEMVGLYDAHTQEPSSFLFKKLESIAEQIEKIYVYSFENITKESSYSDIFRIENSAFRMSVMLFVKHIIFQAQQLILQPENNLDTSKNFIEKQNVIESDVKKLMEFIKLKIQVYLVDENSESLTKIDQKVNEEVHRVAQLLFGEEESSVAVKKLRSLETVFTELGEENAFHLDELNKAKKEIKELQQKLELTSTTFMTELSRLEAQRSFDSQSNISVLNQLQSLILENNNLTKNIKSDMRQMQNEILSLKGQNAAFSFPGNNSSQPIPNEHDKKHSGISSFFRNR